MDIKAFIRDWLAVANAYDTNGYLEKYHADAILEDPSVGRSFVGHPGIRKYFEDYFIGYKTQTRLTRLDIINNDSAHVEVTFTGEFPEGVISGIFELKFKNGKIAFIKADLV